MTSEKNVKAPQNSANLYVLIAICVAVCPHLLHKHPAEWMEPSPAHPQTWPRLACHPSPPQSSLHHSDDRPSYSEELNISQ